ncbi:GIY-YIG nuclease family protein [candidate division KSB1 bacterium]
MGCRFTRTYGNKIAMNMYYTYILKSEKDGGYYYGSSGDMNSRLERHNAGSVKSTKYRRPWTLHYCEEFTSRAEAVKHERYLKSKAGFFWLKNQRII